MKVNILGTSCTWFERNNTSFIIDDKIVFDVPQGSYKNIIKTTDISKLDCVIITHCHTDHFADLHVITTLFTRKFLDRKDKLRIYGPRGMQDLLIAYNTLLYGAEDETSKEIMDKRIEFIELDDGFEFYEGDYVIKAYKMQHGKPETFGFTFKNKVTGKTVGFSADTCYCENLEKILENSNYAFVEMAGVKPASKHICIDEFEQLTKKYGDVKIFPVHTCDECQDYARKNGLNYVEDFQVLELD